MNIIKIFSDARAMARLGPAPPLRHILPGYFLSAILEDRVDDKQV